MELVYNILEAAITVSLLRSTKQGCLSLGSRELLYECVLPPTPRASTFDCTQDEGCVDNPSLRHLEVYDLTLGRQRWAAQAVSMRALTVVPPV